MSTPIDKVHALTLCMAGKGAETCSFLREVIGAELICLKGSDVENLIRGQRETGNIGAQGDNCTGPPDFEPNDA